MGTVSKLPPPRRAGILAQTRSEGFRDGWGQAAMVNEDDAYMRGFAKAEAEIHSRWKRWTLLGAVLGFVAGYLL